MEETDLQILQDLLAKHYMPGQAGDRKAKQVTTMDLFAILDQHAPGRFTPGLLFDALRAAGFVDRLVGDELCWLVQPR